MDAKVEFYNKIYQDRPDKWDLTWRDGFAYYVLSRHTKPPETFLDIGCGNGHTIEYFNKKWPDTIYSGIDLSDEAIRLAEQRVSGAFFNCTSYDDYSSFQYYDVVVLMGVAEHFEDLVPSLRNLKKIGKLIYIESPDCLSFDLANGSPNKEEGFRETYKGAGQMEWHLKKSTWEEKIKFAGLEIVQFYPGEPYSSSFIWVLK